MKEERLKQITHLLLIIDMVNGFVNEGALADPHIRHIIGECLRLTKYFKSIEGGEVAFAVDSHTALSKEFDKFPVHCLKGSEESRIIPELESFSNNSLVYYKNSRSIMFAPGFMDDLKQMENLKEVIIAGCCTDLCDLNAALPLVNYFDEMNQSVEIIVPEDAVETYDSPLHSREEYKDMAFKMFDQEGIKRVRTYNYGGRK